MRYGKGRLLGAAALASLSAAGGAWAQTAPQTAPAADESSVDEIIVTARKRSERLFDVPVAVTVITAETLEERQFQTVREIAQVVPGLNVSSDSAGRANISIRGVGITLLDNVQPGVGIFIDGIYQPNTAYLNSPTIALERIEVLRGPQGTVFGQNTLGGAINITTRQPTNAFEGRVNAAFAGPDNFYTAGLSLSGPLVEDILFARLTVGAQGRDGFVRNSLLGQDDSNKLKQQTLRGSVRWEMETDADLTLNAYYHRVDGAGPLYALTTGPQVYVDDARYNVRSHQDYGYSGVNARFTSPVGGDTDMTVILAHDRSDNESVGDPDFQPINLARRTGETELRATTGEVRFDSEWTDTLSTLVGVFASRQDSFARSSTTLIPLGVTQVATTRAEADVWAVFGAAFWTFAPGWELTTGVRFDHQTVDAVSAIPSRYEADEWQPRVTLRRSMGDTMVYGSIARGFRGGGANGPGAPNLLWDGDSVWTYEIGGRSKLNDGMIQLSGAVFYNEYSDVIGQNSLAPSTTGVGFVGVNLNSGDARSYGVEGEFSAFLTDAWTVNGGVTLMNTRYTNTDRYTATTGRTLPSDRFSFEPDWTVSLQSDYVVDLNGGDLTFSGGVFGKGDRIGASLSNTFAPELDSYVIANATISWKRDTLDLALFANNLFDEEYYESYIDSSVLTVAGLPALGSLGLIGDGRRVGVRLGYGF